MTRRTIALAASCALALIAPAGAQAALTVTRVVTTTSTIEVSETSPAADDLQASRTGNTIVLQRAGGGIAAGIGCSNVAGHVECPSASRVVVGVGAGDDAVTVTTPLGATTFVDGGAGRDLLTGGPGEETLIGGPGPDVFHGGSPGCPPTECSNVDTVDYGPVSATPVVASIDGVANDGPAGEGDDIGQDIERIAGGDGPDTLSAPAPGFQGASLAGSGGADRLSGSPRGDYLDGGPGNDEVHGGADRDFLGGGDGDDVVFGDEGDDLLDVEGGTEGNDELFGGPGEDGTDAGRYGPAPAFDPVPGTASLDDVANDGKAGEADNFHRDIERVSGGRANDTLIGSSGPDELEGGEGDDIVDGAGGSDVLRGDEGDDVLLARDQAQDRLNCGSARDGGTDADRAEADEIDAVFNCESAAIFPIPRPGTPTPPVLPDRAAPTVSIAGLSARVKRRDFRRRGLRFRVRVSEPASLRVHLLAQVRRTGRRIAFAAASGELEIGSRSLGRAGGTRSVPVKPNVRFAKAVRNRRLRLTVRVTATDAAGNDRVVSRRVRVR